MGTWAPALLVPAEKEIEAMTTRLHYRVAGGLLPLMGCALLVALAPTREAHAAAKASVKGSVTPGGVHVALTGVVAFQQGPEVVVLLTDKPVPPGSGKAFDSKWLEGTGLKGVEMKLMLDEPGAGDKDSARVYVRYLPGDGSGAYDSGPHPGYTFERETLDAKHVAGRLHGTIVSSPEQVDVDVSFSAPIE